MLLSLAPPNDNEMGSRLANGVGAPDLLLVLRRCGVRVMHAFQLRMLRVPKKHHSNVRRPGAHCTTTTAAVHGGQL